MTGSDIVSAKVGPAPSDMPPAPGSPAVPGLYVTVRIPGVNDGEDFEALWEADLLEGAVVEQAGTSSALSADLGYAEFNGQLPNGTIVPGLGGGMGNIARGQEFSGATDSDAAITSSANTAAAAYGVTIDSVTVFRVLGDAPAIVVTTPDFSKLASQYVEFRNSLFGATPRYQGYYLEIRASDGTPDLRVSASFVTGIGRIWIDPSVNNTGELHIS